METTNIEESPRISVHLQKKDAKPNAPKYTCTTVREMFAMLNEENVERFLSEFPDMVRSMIAVRQSLQAFAEISGQPLSDDDMAVSEFYWIDD